MEFSRFSAQLCGRYIHYLLLVLLINVAMAYGETPEEPRVRIAIPSQSLAKALLAFSEAYDRLIVAQSVTLAGLKSHEASGHYTASEALSELLIDTGLTLKKMQQDSFAIVLLNPVMGSDLEEFDISALADNAIEEMFILGQQGRKRPKNPVAIVSDFDYQFIQQHNIVSLQQLQHKVPGLTTTPDADGNLKLGLRGISDLGGSLQSSQPIPIHLNGSYVGGLESKHIVLFDLSHITVYHGPQLSEKGRSSVTGSIYIESNKPLLNESQALLSIQAGNYNLRRYEGMVNVPLGDSVALRFAGVTELRDGYTPSWANYNVLDDAENAPLYNYPLFRSLDDTTYYASTVTPDEDHDNSDKYAWRLGASWRINTTTTGYFQWEVHQNDSLPKAYIDPYLVQHDQPGIVVDTQVQQDARKELYGATINHENNVIGLNYSFSRSLFNYSTTRDMDLGRLPGFNEYRVPKHQEEQLSNDIELYGIATPKGFQWLVGMHYEDTALLREDQIDWRHGTSSVTWRQGSVNFGSDINNKYRDLYGQVSKDIAEQWEVTIASRYQYQTKRLGAGETFVCPESISGPQAYRTAESYIQSTCTHSTVSQRYDSEPLTTTWEHASHLIGLNYTVNDSAEGYLSFSSSRLPGLVISGEEKHTQDSNNWELGVKGNAYGTWLDYSAAVFYAQHKNLLYAQSYSIPETSVKGIELTMQLDDVLGGSLAFSGTYLDASVEQFDAFDPVINDHLFNDDNLWNPPAKDSALAQLGFHDLSGNKLPNAAEYSMVLNYVRPFESEYGLLTPHIAFSMIGDQYLDVFNRRDGLVVDRWNNTPHEITNLSRQPAHNVLDISLTWKSPKKDVDVTLALYNVTDERIRIAQREDLFGGEGFASQYLPPRTIRLTASLRF